MNNLIDGIAKAYELAFDEEQKEPPVLTDLFRTMFNTQQPYEYGIGTAPVPKISKSKMYDYNIAQYS